MRIEQLFSDPLAFLELLLVTLPGILLALSGHEAAHAYISNKCGDPTARLMGRISLNPLKHIDPVGFLFMIFVGFGWAKPVPVNPYNLRRGRRDDFFISIAGITANIIMCLIGFVLLTAVFLLALSKLPVYTNEFEAFRSNADMLILNTNGESNLIILNKLNYFQLSMGDVFKTLPGTLSWEFGNYGVYLDAYMLITNTLGRGWEIIYSMLRSFVTINIALAVFNLIPIPPLDGYHVLNDLVLKRPLYAAQKAAQIGIGIIVILTLLGNVDSKYDFISIAVSFVLDNVLGALSGASYAVCGFLGLI